MFPYTPIENKQQIRWMSSTKSQLLNAELWKWQFFGRDEESDASEGEHVQAAICREIR